jgi:hypothetical protein
VRLALILIALTAPVAPACKVTPIAMKMIPGINNAFEPSIRIPTRPRRYGGAQTATPRALLTIVVVSFSRLGWDGFTPINREGTAT